MDRKDQIKRELIDLALEYAVWKEIYEDTIEIATANSRSSTAVNQLKREWHEIKQEAEAKFQQLRRQLINSD